MARQARSHALLIGRCLGPAEAGLSSVTLPGRRLATLAADERGRLTGSVVRCEQPGPRR